jgi:ElaA protein
MIFESKKFSELSAEELYEIMKSRNEIFVIEQNCIYQDCDDRDYGYHVFCRDESGRVAAYMRIYEIDEEPEVIMVDGQAIWSGNLTEEQIKNGTKMPNFREELGISEEKIKNARTVQMGRVLTLEHGKGLGKEVLDAGIKTAWEQMGADRIFIEAEDYVEGYYIKAGFVKTSDVFLKDDIPHVHMELWK